jgi:amidase
VCKRHSSARKAGVEDYLPENRAPFAAMSVFFSSASRYVRDTRDHRKILTRRSTCPIDSDVPKQLLETIGITHGLRNGECEEYSQLLAGLDECAQHIASLPDYEPQPRTRYPRKNIHRPAAEESVLGHAWAHKFHIRGNHQGRSLKGKTVCVKDCIAVADVPQFFGTDAVGPWTPRVDATVVTRALDAGADIVGTATCENFCNSTSSFTSAQGVVDNPYAEGYSAGGSTSGGAALVGGGYVDVAIGADQGGSVRVPAAFCGCMPIS